MAERRMFAKTIIDSDAFIDMPQSTQNLYFHLSMRADDDGFINSPKTIMRSIGCKDDDINLLIMKKFIIPFENGIVVIKHWKIHNYIQSDRHTPTKYIDQKKQLELDENKAYRLLKDDCIQNVSTMYTQVSIGKDSIGKYNKDNTMEKKTKNKFVIPSVDEVDEYIKENKFSIDPNAFVDYYTTNGWIVNGKTKMKDWKASVRTWERNNKNKPIYTNYPKKEVRIEPIPEYISEQSKMSDEEMTALKLRLKNMSK